MDGVSTSAVDFQSPSTSKQTKTRGGDTSFADLLERDAKAAPDKRPQRPIKQNGEPLVQDDRTASLDTSSSGRVLDGSGDQSLKEAADQPIRRQSGALASDEIAQGAPAQPPPPPQSGLNAQTTPEIAAPEAAIPESTAAELAALLALPAQLQQNQTRASEPVSSQSSSAPIATPEVGTSPSGDPAARVLTKQPVQAPQPLERNTQTPNAETAATPAQGRDRPQIAATPTALNTTPIADGGDTPQIPLSDVIAALRFSPRHGAQSLSNAAASTNAEIAPTADKAAAIGSQSTLTNAPSSQTLDQTLLKPQTTTPLQTAQAAAGAAQAEAVEIEAADSIALQFISQSPSARSGAAVTNTAANAATNSAASANNAPPQSLAGASAGDHSLNYATVKPNLDAAALSQTTLLGAGELAADTLDGLADPKLAAGSSNASSTTPPAQALPTALKGASPAVTQVFSRFVERFDGRSQRFDIRLDPPELGKVDVKIEISSDSKVQAVLAARDPAALADLMKGARALETALAEAGIDLAEEGLEFQLAPDNGGYAFDDGDDAADTDATSQTELNSDAETDAENAPAPSRAITPELTAWRRTRFDVTA